jgi:hypothetical protein
MRRVRKSPGIFFILIFLLSISAVAAETQGKTIYWSDTGITPLGKPPQGLKNLGNKFNPVQEVPQGGKIIVRMPEMKDGQGKKSLITWNSKFI